MPLRQDRATREKQLKQLDADLRELNKKIQEPMPGELERLTAKGIAKIRGEKMGSILICRLLPAFNMAQSAAERYEQQSNNLYLAFALSAYRRDHGDYPKKLGELSLRYLDRLPIDLFSGEPLVYRPSENGYLLYSVGVNGQDKSGRGPDDQPPGDDWSVQMPLPKLKQK